MSGVDRVAGMLNKITEKLYGPAQVGRDERYGHQVARDDAQDLKDRGVEIHYDTGGHSYVTREDHSINEDASD